MKNRLKKSSRLHKIQGIHRKVSFQIKSDALNSEREAHKSTISEKSPNFSSSLLLPYKKPFINDSERNKDPQYGEVISPESFSFVNYKPDYKKCSYLEIPYSVPITNNFMHNENPDFVHNVRFMPYTGFQNIFPYPNTMDLYTYFGRCNQMYGNMQGYY